MTEARKSVTDDVHSFPASLEIIRGSAWRGKRALILISITDFLVYIKAVLHWSSVKWKCFNGYFHNVSR